LALHEATQSTKELARSAKDTTFTSLVLLVVLVNDVPSSLSASDVHFVTIRPIIRILETVDRICIDNIGWQAVPRVDYSLTERMFHDIQS